MTTKEILNLDYREEKNKKIIQKVLKQIKPLSKYSDEDEIPFSAIEKANAIMCKKYMIRINTIMPDITANTEYIIWKASLTNDTNLKIIDTVYGVTLYEMFAKVAIRLYAEVKKGIKVRN